MGDDPFPSRPSTRDREQRWQTAAADLPSPPALLEGLHRQLTDKQSAEGYYERTGSRRVDGVDRYERSVVLVGDPHRSIVHVDVTEAGRVIVSHRLAREREGFLDRFRRGGADARRGIDAATVDLLQAEQRAAIREAVDGRVVKHKTTDRLAGFALAFESAKSAPPQLPTERTGVADYLSTPFPALASRVVAIERRAHSTR